VVRRRRAVKWHSGFGVVLAAALSRSDSPLVAATTPLAQPTPSARPKRSDKAAYLSKYNAESGSLQKSNGLPQLLGLTGMSFQVLGTLVDMFSDLDNVAPDDIETQVAAVRDSLKKEEDQLSRGRTRLAVDRSSLRCWAVWRTALESSGDWTAVGNYVQTSCHTT
jgi:hypothetical protein